MAAKSISAHTAEHYAWGNACDAWYLVRTPTLHIIEEQMPPGASETPHHHTHARQFFYVLVGDLTLIVDQESHTLHAHEGLEVAPGEIHQALNRSDTPVRFLVTSNPPSHADRIEAWHLAPIYQSSK
jgi:mannose-6-phosphate isomerase-like protein (cupin superfamily)